MISISKISSELSFWKRKPATSKDFKCFDDFDIKDQFWIVILEEKTPNVERFPVFWWCGRLLSVCNRYIPWENPQRRKISSVLMIWMSTVGLQSIFFMEKPVTSKDFTCFDDLEVYCRFSIDIFHGTTRNVERFQVFWWFGCLISVRNWHFRSENP